MKLLHKSGELADSHWTLLDDGVTTSDSAAVAISYERYLAAPDEWDARTTPWTVVLAPADDLLDVSQQILARSQILISFPAYTDGRGYSHAATLRQHHNYQGDLLATGDVRRDQLAFMAEVGINLYEVTGNDSVDHMLLSLGELAMPEPHRLYSGAAL